MNREKELSFYETVEKVREWLVKQNRPQNDHLTVGDVASFHLTMNTRPAPPAGDNLVEAAKFPHDAFAEEAVNIWAHIAGEYTIPTADHDRMLAVLDTYDSLLRGEWLAKMNNIARSVSPADDKWIPVSKRLPIDFGVRQGLYEVTIEGSDRVWIENWDVTAQSQWGSFSYKGEWLPCRRKVIAWQPLPEPYQPDREFPVKEKAD